MKIIVITLIFIQYLCKRMETVNVKALTSHLKLNSAYLKPIRHSNPLLGINLLQILKKKRKLSHTDPSTLPALKGKTINPLQNAIQKVKVKIGISHSPGLKCKNLIRKEPAYSSELKSPRICILLWKSEHPRRKIKIKEQHFLESHLCL